MVCFCNGSANYAVLSYEEGHHNTLLKFKECGRLDRGIFVLVYGVDPILIFLQVPWHFMPDTCTAANSETIQ